MASARIATGGDGPTRRRRLAAALMSGLIFPGAGQFLNRRYGQGVLFAGLAAIAILAISIEVSLVVLRAVPVDAFAIDPAMIAVKARQALVGSSGRLAAWIIGLAGVWLASIVDAWIDARSASPRREARRPRTMPERTIPVSGWTGHSVRMPRVIRIDFSGDSLVALFGDGRSVSAPLDWWPRLAAASAEERRAWELVDGGQRVRWPALEVELSVADLLGARDK
jgi:TM2 domain-containing membrane protein YozV